MKQPKFKLGERLRNLVLGGNLNVTSITIYRDSFIYGGHDDEGVALDTVEEKYLASCPKPKEKKLYAYRVLGFACEIKFFMGELKEDVIALNKFDRIPCYDLDYDQFMPRFVADIEPGKLSQQTYEPGLLYKRTRL